MNEKAVFQPVMSHHSYIYIQYLFIQQMKIESYSIVQRKQKMKYNTVPDQSFHAVSREIDKYSSALFMCSTRLLIAERSLLRHRIQF